MAQRNHSFDQDYDPDGANWVDITRLGSPWDEQIDIAVEGHYRHRKALTSEPWRKGAAPHDREADSA